MSDLTPQAERACDHALGLLDEADERAFLASLDDPHSPTDFELAAAELELGVLGLGGVNAERIPEELEKRLEAAATAYGWALTAAPANLSQGAPDASQTKSRAGVPGAGFDWGRYLGWAAAAVALLVTAAVLSQRPTEPVAALPPQVPSVEPVVDAAPPPTPVEERQALLEGGQAVKLSWSATKDEAASGASGDVVWSGARQVGYMRFKGLKPNDPKEAQYQLWIFAKGQDERYPVDGGVFDVDSSGEVVVAIDPKLHVDEPTLFAVTVEKPGGVVVSKRERIVLTAAAGG
ncbi:MAG: anti-sigma factor [Polyangiaceae bacterium]|nr:anti-sigma factor [Myxococcales bacterium]MCB9587575.1 anti-sigma factor [Polyangiaceae bacterium]MCB9605628.1 anti-sigma factor [Polyangiaceae bacterium]